MTLFFGKKKKWLYSCLVVVSLCFYTHSFAQFSVGIEGGYNKNYLITNNANRPFTNYKPLSSFTIGIPVQYQIADWFAVEADPTFIQKNYRQERSAFFSGVFQNNYNTYVQLPLMAHFMFGGNRLKGFTNVGLYGAYWMASTVKGVMPNILNNVDNNTATNSIYDYNNPYNYNEKYTFDNRKDNRLEIGWLAGLGIGYDVTSHINVFAEGRLLYGFTDQQKAYETNQMPRYNTTMGINAGVLYRFGNSKSSY